MQNVAVLVTHMQGYGAPLKCEAFERFAPRQSFLRYFLHQRRKYPKSAAQGVEGFKTKTHAYFKTRVFFKSHAYLVLFNILPSPEDPPLLLPFGKRKWGGFRSKIELNGQV